ncbi:Uncharacterized protein APZ42_019763 [Daphnia magna]|uniref:Uncharacterized protein n=1 Tax=Daphnia magna TaxID=35525 RepID=A0A164XNS8_9CRUS|nr:Uncharacterized protein APZ42_019763 [Daphnia magna]
MPEPFKLFNRLSVCVNHQFGEQFEFRLYFYRTYCMMVEMPLERLPLRDICPRYAKHKGKLKSSRSVFSRAVNSSQKLHYREGVCL